MWEAIRQNKIKSVLLISLMGLLLLALGAVFGAVIARGGGGVLAGISIAGVLWFFLTFVALIEGKNILLAFSGAKEVQSEDAPQLYNIVEEMKIASGLPTLPKIYIIESKAPNAFAVGSPDNCAVAITSGLLAVLTRDELQGVIAHEIGHIKNQDTKFLTITGVMLGTIVILSDIFTRTLFYGNMMGGRRSRSSRDSGGQAQVVLIVVGIILAILAPLLAQIIYLACSRSREYLADASAAVFTRFPEGLASALEKISARASIPLEAANRVTAPMFIVPPMGLDGKSFASVFSTHPPTEERVKILRSMSGGAGFSEYNKVFRQVNGTDVINPENLLSAEQLKLRGISRDDDKTEKRRSREANDLVMKLHNYKFINCECGIKIKIPPNYQDSGIRCPRCGMAHSI
jgi:heat shock protein HtpX